jgi:RNA polymerase sigma factor (sigma-70 family)
VRSRSDATLVAAVLDGDGAAFADLYDRYADRVHAFIFSRLRNETDAADALQNTFIKAHQHLAELVDPARFRAWLFAIARTSITDLGRDRTRRAAAPIVDEATEMAADLPDHSHGLQAAETGALLWSAATALQPRDQELLELHLREGLDGSDLAMAMGVEPSHVYVMVKRMKERLATAVGSLLVARVGRGECPQLHGLLEGWEGTFSLAVRSQVTRHVEQCDTCTRTKKAAISWEGIATAMPSVAAPTSIRDVVLATIGVTSPGPSNSDSVLASIASSVLIIIATIGVLAFPVWGKQAMPESDSFVADVIEETTSTTTPPPEDPATSSPRTTSPTASAIATTAASTTTMTEAPDTSAIAATTLTTPIPTTTTTEPALPPPTTTTTTTPTTLPPIGPILTVSITTIDFGGAGDVASFVISNSGDRAFEWASSLDPTGFFAISVDHGALDPGQSEPVTITFLRLANQPEGDYASMVTIQTSGAGSASVALSAAVERAPQVDFTFLPDPGQNPVYADGPTCLGLPTTVRVVATVADSSPIVSVVASWRGGSRWTELVPGLSATSYSGTVGPWEFLAETSVEEVLVVAIDSRGNQTDVSKTLTIHRCD